MRLVTVLWHRLHPPARESSAMWPSVRDRLIGIPSKRKYCLAAASGFVSLIVVAGLAFHVVGSVKRQSDATDRMHAVLIELSAIGANAENMERLERDVSVNRVAMAAAFAEANENMARSIGALESLIPEDSARRALLRDMSKLVARQRISLLKQQPSEITDGSAEPWLSLGDDIEVLAHQMWQAEKRELDVSKAAEHEGFAHIRNWVVAIAIAACLPGALLLLLLRHDVVTQRRAAALLARVNSRLDLKVKERTAELAAANERLHELSARIQAAREEERLHIAREVHDELGSTLTALKLELSGSAKQLDASGNHRLRHRRASADLVDMALQTVQNVVTALRPSVLDKFGLWEAIAWKAEQFEDRTGTPCKVTMLPSLPQLSGEVAIGIYRVLEEALTNVTRHAGASRVDVVIELHDSCLRLSISDDGCGITKEQILSPESYGLLTMHERARLWGGVFHIDRNQAGGTTAWVEIPLYNKLSECA